MRRIETFGKDVGHGDEPGGAGGGEGVGGGASAAAAAADERDGDGVVFGGEDGWSKRAGKRRGGRPLEEGAPGTAGRSETGGRSHRLLLSVP